jgi:phosphoribosyl 1,2-cyclic phosphodiesterase
MKLTALASGSSGNAYILDDGKTRLLLECGLPFKELQRLTKYSLGTFDSCLVTHEHNDHSNAANELWSYGVRVYCSQGTAQSLKIEYYQLEAETVEEIGTFLVQPFTVEHDAAEPLGFLIKSTVDGEQMVFATDTYYLENRFPAADIWAIECNYSEDLVPAACPRADRLFTSHMSLKQCIDTLKANDLSKCREIHLLHLSDAHSDEDRFIREVQEATGIPTYAASGYERNCYPEFFKSGEVLK